MSRKLVAPIVLCTQRSWQAEMTTYWTHFDLASSKAGSYGVWTGIYLTTRARMTFPVIRHLGFPVANLLFNLQLFWWELIILRRIFRRNMSWQVISVQHKKNVWPHCWSCTYRKSVMPLWHQSNLYHQWWQGMTCVSLYCEYLGSSLWARLVPYCPRQAPTPQFCGFLR